MLKQQKGQTWLSALLIIGVIVFFLRIGMIAIPAYFDDSQVNIILGNLDLPNEDPFSRTNFDIKSWIDKRLKDNNLPIDTSGLVIKRSPNTIDLQWQYERRGNLLGNIDIVLNFTHEKKFSIE
ncbi:MAG: DUF4845 domain-containing protein [Oleibacter sp.]|nr:DUF4845 domain-containing protein [Thalassolituus sp.]